MRNLLTHPLWQADDLGQPIPDSPHAVSVALPLWSHVVGYEEGAAFVHERLRLGYPRFVFHPRVAELFRDCERRFAGADEFCLALPSERTAAECAAFVRLQTGAAARINAVGADAIHAVTAPIGAKPAAKAYWQHTGWVVSSRQAEAVLAGKPADEARGEAARNRLRRRLAGLYGAASDDVFLFPSGAAALATANRILQTVHPGRRSVQFGFPYVDTLKVQEKFGPGARFFPGVGPEQHRELAALLGAERVSGVVTEVPSNPLLETALLARLRELMERCDGLVVVDDTVGTPVNVDVTPWADLIAISLTKFVCGVGDALGGALVVNPRSARHGDLRGLLAAPRDERLWWADAVVLERRSRDFVARMRRINDAAAALAARLRSHPSVEALYYPKYDATGAYERLRRPDGGYGGLLSILTREAPRTAPLVYDRLRVCKGPSLGTNYTLACPYTLLAHYRELDWAESCGVSRWLIRVSVGLEEIEDLWSRFEAALG